MLEGIVKFNNPEVVENALNENCGVFFLSGHLSNWELTAFAYAKIFDQPLNIIAKRQASEKLNKKINEYRQMSGNNIVEIGHSLKKIYGLLQENKIVCFLVDQAGQPDYSVYVDFFGVKTATFSGPAKLALRMNPVLLLAYGLRNKEMNYEIYFKKIEYAPDSENVEELTRKIQSQLEEVIRKEPSQWLWFHKRFKHRK